MENERKMDTPRLNQDTWSPDVLFGNLPHSSGTRMTSTPYPGSFKNLDESEGSTKQDSGYCSATPRSADSTDLMFGNCRLCSKSLHHNSYAQSTPSKNICNCKKYQIDGSLGNVECMEAIQESPTRKLSVRVRMNRPLELYEDVDASLYHEEMEVDHFSSGGNHQCAMEVSELGEEKSIDFMEPHVFSQLSGKTTPSVSVPSNMPTNVNIEGSCSQSSENLQFKSIKDNVEEFFSPEIFNCDLVSPKIKNESTPTKFKRGTPPSKMKKVSAFHSSAKKVASLNRVLRAFFPLNGIESVDFLYQFGVKRNCQHVVSRIFCFLSEKDLDAVRVVSKTWNKLLYNDFAAFSRWQLYSSTIALMKENLSSPVKQGGSGGRYRPALTRLQNMTNQTSPPRQLFSPQQSDRSPPVSPGNVRFYSFQRAGKSLKKDERLLPCPKCRFASTDRGSPVVQCPRSGCRHRFCVWCNIEVLPDLQHNCPPLYTPRCHMRRNAVHSVGSKTSKRNLRRL